MIQPKAFYFGSDQQPLFGWLHPVAPQVVKSVGLVICSPFGFEEECAHKSLRHLALDAAEAGIPTLRFDYATCGNSAGDEFGENTFEAWVGSVGAAIEALKAHSGVSRVCVAGLRLGATLGALACMQRLDVEAFVAIAPVVQGKGYVRELKILELTGFQGDSKATADDLMQASGYVLSMSTREAVTTVDLRTAKYVPAPNIFIIERDDITVAPEWKMALESLGAKVKCAVLPGYRDMMSDPQSTVVPKQIIASILEFIGTLARTGQNSDLQQLREVQTSCSVLADGSNPVLEGPVEIEVDGASLFGIVTRPEVPKPVVLGRSGVAVVLISSGTLHNIGPGRMWPVLARHWASQGATVLRVDLPGIGESQALPTLGESVVYSDQYMHSLSKILEYMKGLTIDTEIHLVGLCSGATHAFKAAVQGQEWGSFILINPLTFSYEEVGEAGDSMQDYEIEGAASKYKKLIFSLTPWKKLFSGQLDLRFIFKVLKGYVARALTSVLNRASRAGGRPSSFDLELTGAAKRSNALQLVFCENSIGERFLHSNATNVLESLLLRKMISIESILNSDHTFTKLDARNRLVKVLDSKVWNAWH